MAPSCNATLILGREDHFLFHACVVHTARSDSACVSLSLSDRWLPDITHPVRRPLILNITALALLFIFFLCKPRHFFSQSKDIQLANCMFLWSYTKKKKKRERKKESGHRGTSNLAPRVAFVLSKGLRLFLLKRRTAAAQSTRQQHLTSFAQKIMTKQIRGRQALMAIVHVDTVFRLSWWKLTLPFQKKNKNKKIKYNSIQNVSAYTLLHLLHLRFNHERYLCDLQAWNFTKQQNRGLVNPSAKACWVWRLENEYPHKVALFTPVNKTKKWIFSSKLICSTRKEKKRRW